MSCMSLSSVGRLRPSNKTLPAACSASTSSAKGHGHVVLRALGRYPGPFEDVGTDMLKAPKLVLSDPERIRLDENPDQLFYSTPRLMQHADQQMLDSLRELYGGLLRPGSCVLELCASAHSHLPDQLELGLLVGQGMNRQELDANPRLHQYFIQDLNLQPLLLEQLDSSYDAVLCANGIQYLTQPETVIAEASRVLRPGGVLVVAFGPDCFRQKALAGWLSRDMQERSTLVQNIIQANGFEAPVLVDSPAAAAAAAVAARQTEQQPQPSPSQPPPLQSLPAARPAPLLGTAATGTHAPAPSAATAAAAGRAASSTDDTGAFCVLVARKSLDWTAGAAEADLAFGVDMRPDNVEAWFTKPGLAGLAEAATAQAQPSVHSTSHPASSATPTVPSSNARAASQNASSSSNINNPAAGGVVNERLLEQWLAAYESLVVDAVDLGIPRSAIPTIERDVTPAQLQEAVEHLQAMMASFLSAGL